MKKIAKKLLDEWGGIMLQIELESDESFLKDVERARNGEELMDHDERCSFSRGCLQIVFKDPPHEIITVIFPSRKL